MNNKINKIKLALGCFLVFVSIVGFIPILKDDIVLDGSAKTYSEASRSINGAYHVTHLSETNYPILVGCLCLSGSLLILSVKEK